MSQPQDLHASPEEKHHEPSIDVHTEDVAHSQDEDWAWDADVIANLTALYLIYFASTWAMAVPSSSIAFIMYEFPGDHTTTTWVAAAPSFCLCVIDIFLGDISDIFGRKEFLVIGAVLGVACMLVGGRAGTIPMLIGGQVLNGLALTLGFLSTPLLAEVVPKRWRAPVVGGGTFLAAIAGLAGQISQGAFMKHAVGGQNKGWRIGFYLGAGFFFIALVGLVILYKPGPRPNPENLSVKKRLLKIDWIGIFLGTAALLLILLGLQYGGNPFAWNSPRVLAFLIVGIVTLLVFAGWEWKGVDEGLFSKSLFEHRNFAIALALNFIEGMVIFSSQAFMPQIILALLTDDLVLSAVYNLPNAGGSICGVLGAAVIASKTRESKWIAVAGVACLALGGGLLAVMQPGINFAAWFFPSMLVGAGIGSLGVIIPVISTLCTPNRYIATAVALGTSIRGLGGAVGVVILTQIFSSKIAEILPKKVVASVLDAGLPPSSVPALLEAFAENDAEALSQIPDITGKILYSLQHAAAKSYADSFRFVWYSLIPFAVVTLLMSCLLKTTKDQMSLQVASRVQRHYVYERKMEEKTALDG